jgi:hypothetical protein
MEPSAKHGPSAGDAFDRVLRNHRQLLREALDDIRWWKKIEELELSDRSRCAAQLAVLSSEAKREGSRLLPNLTRLKDAYEAYLDDNL